MYEQDAGAAKATGDATGKNPTCVVTNLLGGSRRGVFLRRWLGVLFLLIAGAGKKRGVERNNHTVGGFSCMRLTFKCFSRRR